MRIDRVKLVTELARRDMSQRQLSELSGVSRVTINGIRGGRSCSEATAQKIADALNIDLKKILE